LLTQDLAALDSLAREDAWKLTQYQAIMTALGISPMPVDGKPGASTRRGLKAFQLAYNAG